MASKYENIWELLNKFNFEIECSDSFTDLTCVICKKILSNTRQSFCGCRYCLKCIENYLNGENKLCPGVMDECKDQLLSIQGIQLDYVADMKVSRIPVRCPEPYCKYIDELRKMEDHINAHQLKCPFFDIGCTKPDICHANVAEHLQVEGFSHSILLIESIQNMKNEMASLRENSDKKDALILALQNQINKMMITNNMNSTNVDQLKNSLDLTVIQKLHSDQKNMDNEMKNIRKSVQKKDTQINALNLKVDQLLKSQAKPPGENKADQKKGFSVLTNEKFVFKTEDLNVSKAFNGIFYTPYQWTIDNFTEKRSNAKELINSFVLSEAFYTGVRGYKLCLTVYPDGCVSTKNANLCIGFHIMHGEYNEILPWPMTIGVTVGLVDQKSNSFHSYFTFSYDSCPDKKKSRFMKPVSGMNKALGITNFINLKSLLGNGKLFKNDSVVIRCSISTAELVGTSPMQFNESNYL